MWNAKSHDTVGFAGSFMDVDSTLRRILCGNDDNVPATHVNLWKYRSDDNTTVDCEFFYTGDAMTSGDVRKQFYEVLTNLELIRCRVSGCSADADQTNVSSKRHLSEATSR